MEISPAEIPLPELGNPRASSEREFGGLNDPQTEEAAATTVSLPKKSEDKDDLEERASLGSRETGCETEENVQSGKDTTQQSDIHSLPPSNSSSDENICRICQESSKDTEEPVQTTRCSCKGATARIHRSCLREWVRHQRSVRCEICKGRFEGITPPGSLERAIDRHMDQNYMPAEDITETIHQLYYHLHRLRPFTRRRRAAIAATIVFLALVTCMSAVMTVEADREYRQVSKNPWSTQHSVDQSGIIFSICVASAFFCATLTIGLLVIWAGVECTYHIQRRALYRRVERSVLENMGRHHVINVI